MADQNMSRTNYWQIPRSFSQQINAAFINLQFYISYYFFQAELPAVIFPHPTFAFTMTVTLALLQVKYQVKDSKTPFESHPLMTSIAITSFLLYCFAYSIELRRSSSNLRYPIRVRNLVRCSLLLTGSLCVATTASFLFPDSVKPVVFIFYFMSSAAELLFWVYQRFIRVSRASHERGRRIQQIFMNIWSFMTRCFNNRRPILPL
ncbi:hypothetical protein ACH5RR_011952 [Cinchona calisaya]|uniref:Uncharacterized protein n=1 Tax=Cinchona calisaya TaxID=153742 RepID=A0ABD3A6B1_9GENT